MRLKTITLASILALGVFTAPSPKAAQEAQKVYRIGYLSPRVSSVRPKAFREGLRELGYIEGQNLVIEERSAKGKRDRLPKLAAELVGLNLDVIFTWSNSAVQALKEATTTTPIVSVSGDPVLYGHVASLAHPGGNITGLANVTPELAGKRLELLQELLPEIAHVAVLWNKSPSSVVRMKEMEVAARWLGIKLQSVTVERPNDFERAFSAMKKERVDAFVNLRTVLIMTHLHRIVELAAESRLPAMYDGLRFPEAGGLMGYGPEFTDLDRRAATYVDKILKGAKPAELPIEQPTKFYLVINLKTAKQLGITFPASFLYRADKVIR